MCYLRRGRRPSLTLSPNATWSTVTNCATDFEIPPHRRLHLRYSNQSKRHRLLSSKISFIENRLVPKSHPRSTFLANFQRKNRCRANAAKDKNGHNSEMTLHFKIVFFRVDHERLYLFISKISFK